MRKKWLLLNTFQPSKISTLPTYQRPADPAGLRYWAEQLEKAQGDLKSIVDAFANSDEAKSLYTKIDSDNIGSVIDAVCKAFFAPSLSRSLARSHFDHPRR